MLIGAAKIRKKIFAASAALLFLVALVYLANMGRNMPEGGGGANSPYYGEGRVLSGNFPLQPLSGKLGELNDYKGKVVLINFWAGWCGPCIHEMPGLYALHERYKDKGFVVLGINMDDDPADGQRVLERRVGSAPFPIFRGTESKLADSFALEGLPYSVIIDREQKIHFARAGEVDWSGSEVRTFIERLL